MRSTRRLTFLSNKTKVAISALFGGWVEEFEIYGKSDYDHLGLG